MAHYLQHNFGLPYDENYYNGDWMMGPNYFCWQPFCNIHIQLYAYGFLKTPSSYKELEDTIEMIMKHKTSIDRYRYCFYNHWLGLFTRLKSGYYKPKMIGLWLTFEAKVIVVCYSFFTEQACMKLVTTVLWFATVWTAGRQQFLKQLAIKLYKYNNLVASSRQVKQAIHQNQQIFKP